MAAEGGCLEDVFVDAETAEKVAAATSTVQALEEAEETLKAAGCLKEAQDCRRRRGVVQKRMRELAREDDGLLLALAAQRDHEAAQQAKRRRWKEAGVAERDDEKLDPFAVGPPKQTPDRYLLEPARAVAYARRETLRARMRAGTARNETIPWSGPYL